MASDPVFERWGSDTPDLPSDVPPGLLRIRVGQQSDSSPVFERWGSSIDGAIETGKGLAKAADAGVARGVAGLAGLPDAVSNLGAEGLHQVTQYVAKQLGLDYQRPGTQKTLSDLVTGAKSSSGSPLRGILPTTEGTQKSIEDTFYEGKPLYEPQTRAERYARTGGEFAAGALAGPANSVRNVVGNVVKYGVLPGVASEAAGEATKDTGYETVARVGAGLLTAGVAGAVSRPGTAAQAVRQQLPPGVTPQMVDQASVLMADAARQGITLSWPEALSQVAGRPVLSNLARHLEAAPATEARMAEFYGQRPQQVENAAQNQFNRISPVNNAPHNIGPDAGTAVAGAVDDVRQTINTIARPHYAAAEGVLLNPAEMARVRAIPGYAEAAADVRNITQLNRYVAHLPENSVGFLNEVKKRLDWQANQARSPIGPQGIPNQQIAGGLTSDAAAARQTGINATGGATGPYATALGIEERGRTALERVLQGPIGKIASKDTTTRQAIEALFPQNPLANSADEVSRAVTVLANRSPRVAGDLVRAHVETTFNEATQALQSGANQAGGAKFAAVLVGNPQQRANLEAAVTALPNGADRWAGFNRFLEILEATGTRQNVGSKTAYNAEFLKDAASSGIVGEVAKGAANPVSRFTAGLIEKYERYKLGNNLNELADILTNPAAVGQLRAIARMPPNSPQAAAIAWRLTNLVRSGTSTSQPVQQPRQ